jgi:hypothetical protein
LAQVFLKKLGAASVSDEEEQEKKNKTISGIAPDGIFFIEEDEISQIFSPHITQI